MNFTQSLDSFYRNPYEYAGLNPIWFAQYLVLMAFGKALDPATQLNSAVSELFARAMRMIPDMAYLCDHPVESTELCCAIALYLQSIYRRQAALVYTGQAVRIGQLHALHTDLEATVFGEHLVRRGRRIWWTVYSLNQKITSSIGLPNYLRDADMTSPMPSASDPNDDDAALAIYVKICRLLGYMIDRVYNSSENSRRSFISTTRAVLTGAAGVADELKLYSNSRFGEISRVSAHLELAYHQCIIFACRPVVFHVLQRQLSTAGNQSVSSAVMGLLQVCVESATQAIYTLSRLHSHKLLDFFLPFDLECGFSAAMILVMAKSSHSQLLSQQDNLQAVLDILDAMTARGNVQANLRKLEVVQLMNELQLRTQPDQAGREGTISEHSELWVTASMPHTQLQFSSPFFGDWTFGSGLSSTQIMELAEALDPGDFRPTNHDT